jgi:hypothetical protein
MYKIKKGTKLFFMPSWQDTEQQNSLTNATQKELASFSCDTLVTPSNLLALTNSNWGECRRAVVQAFARNGIQGIFYPYNNDANAIGGEDCSSIQLALNIIDPDAISCFDFHVFHFDNTAKASDEFDFLPLLSKLAAGRYCVQSYDYKRFLTDTQMKWFRDNTFNCQEQGKAKIGKDR